MLDYKIKELKKQIEPRELEIKDMKEQITNVRLTVVDSVPFDVSILDGVGTRAIEQKQRGGTIEERRAAHEIERVELGATRREATGQSRNDGECKSFIHSSRNVTRNYF